MCYSALVKRDLKLLESRFGATVIRDGFEAYQRQSSQDPKAFPPAAPRIYPGHHAPVVALAGHAASGQDKIIELMRYSVDPPPYIPTPQRYTTFNARRDNLTSKFWSEAFMVHHGIVLLEGFYEWVDVKDLLKAGVVTLAQVKAEFERQSEERRKKLEDSGKKWKPTKTELSDPRLRKIVINFHPDDGDELVVPVIYSVHGNCLGFALITDDPPNEVRAAGHDRCPIALSPDAVEAWLDVGNKSAAEAQQILAERRRVHFAHALAGAA